MPLCTLEIVVAATLRTSRPTRPSRHWSSTWVLSFFQCPFCGDCKCIHAKSGELLLFLALVSCKFCVVESIAFPTNVPGVSVPWRWSGLLPPIHMTPPISSANLELSCLSPALSLCWASWVPVYHSSPVSPNECANHQPSRPTIAHAYPRLTTWLCTQTASYPLFHLTHSRIPSLPLCWHMFPQMSLMSAIMKVVVTIYLINTITITQRGRIYGPRVPINHSTKGPIPSMYEKTFLVGGSRPSRGDAIVERCR